MKIATGREGTHKGRDEQTDRLDTLCAFFGINSPTHKITSKLAAHAHIHTCLICCILS